MAKVSDKPFTPQPGVVPNGSPANASPSINSQGSSTPPATDAPFSADRLDAPKRPKVPSYICTGAFGEHDQLSVIPEGVTPPQGGQWIAQKDLQPTLELLDNIMAGRTAVTVDDNTKPAFMEWILPKSIAEFIGKIFSRNCPGFRESIQKDLKQLARTPMGRELLRELTSSEFPVVIRPTTGSGGIVKPDSESRARRQGNTPSGGSASTVHIPRDLTDTTMVVYRRPSITDYSPRALRNPPNPTSEDEIPQPRFMILAHELVHVHRAQRGMIEPKGSHRSDGYLNQEEFETIAGNSYKFTENKLRQSFGMPSRFGHFRHRL